MKTIQTLLITAFTLTTFFVNAQTTVELNINNMRNNGSATITKVPSNLDLDKLFDGDLNNHSVSWHVNPIVVTIDFNKQQRIKSSTLWMEHGEWTVESANTLADLDSKTGSYKKIIAQAAPGVKQTLSTPTEAKLLRLTALEINGDKVVHLQEWKVEVEANLVLDLRPSHSQLTIPENTIIDFTIQGRDDTRGIIVDIPNATADWSSTNTSVVDVSYNGRLTSKIVGSATVRVEVGTMSTTLPVTVIDEQSTTATNLPPRGIADDGWADIIIGQRDFSEITPNEVTPYALFNPGGVFVDRDGTQDKLLVWDSGNNRVLGFELGGNFSTPISASLVIGQPSGYRFSGCNQESGFQNYPNRANSSASSLCGCDEGTFTITENKSFVTMAKDKFGNIYIPDFMNHRILKYYKPFETDAVADDVWGQADFEGNLANRVSRAHSSIPGDEPRDNADKNTLCFSAIGSSSAAVYIDDIGNMWVCDGGNNRVLRFPFNPTTQQIAKDADLVLGQPDFNKGGDYSNAHTQNPNSLLDRMNSPTGVLLKDNVLYVCDNGNKRILKFEAPFSNGMSAAGTFGTFNSTSSPISMKVAPDNSGMYVSVVDGNSWNTLFQKLDFSGNLISTDELQGRGFGGFDFGRDGDLFHTSYVSQQVYGYEKVGSKYEKSKEFFEGYKMNVKSEKAFGKSVNGIEVTEEQFFAVTNGRVYYYNDKDALQSGQAADGVLGATDFVTEHSQEIIEVEADQAGHLWVVRSNNRYPQFDVYDLPITSSSTPIKTFGYPFNVVGSSEKLDMINRGINWSIAPGPNSEFLWVVDADNNRVFRLRDPLNATPMVDIILGQTEISGNQCNRGVVPAPNTGTHLLADITMLCRPGAVEIDKLGNLYVSDHSLEAEGNWRMLMFKKEDIQNTGSTVKMAIAATKEFPKSDKTWSWQPGFDSKNRMMVGYNIYSGARFVGAYDDPLSAKTTPDFYLNDYGTNPFEVEFDEDDNIYVADLNRCRVLVYKSGDGEQPIADFGLSLSSVDACGTTTVTFRSDAQGATSWSWTFPGGTPFTSTDENPTVTYAKDGTYDVTLTVSNAHGSDTKTIKGMIKVIGAEALPLQEDFESSTRIPDDWPVINPDAGATWILSLFNSGYAKGFNSLAFNNYSSYSSNKIGERDMVYTPAYSLDGLTKASLTFDVAASRYNNTWFDSLIVKVSTDCGETWDRVYAKGNKELATAPDKRGGQFVPKADQWRTESINMDAYAGEPSVMLAFENWAGWGQWIYVDNIMLSESPDGDVTSIEEQENFDFAVYPNPNNGLFTIAFPTANEQAQVFISNALGQVVYNTTNGGQPMLNVDLSSYEKGVYMVRVVTEGQQKVQRILVQ